MIFILTKSVLKGFMLDAYHWLISSKSNLKLSAKHKANYNEINVPITLFVSGRFWCIKIIIKKIRLTGIKCLSCCYVPMHDIVLFWMHRWRLLEPHFLVAYSKFFLTCSKMSFVSFHGLHRWLYFLLVGGHVLYLVVSVI